MIRHNTVDEDWTMAKEEQMGNTIAAKPVQSGGRWEKLASGAGFGAAITLAVVLAGAVASLYPNAIRGLAAFPADNEGGWAAWWFIGLVGIALALLLVNQKAIYTKSGREQRALSATLTSLDSQQSAFTDSLEQLNAAVQRLNTLPSQSFLPAFRDSYKEAFGLTLGCIGNDSGVLKTEIAIRSVLGAIIETAKDFDGAAQETVYGANIMLFRPRAHAPMITDALGLVTVTEGHAEYLGSLELIPELSTSSLDPWNVDKRTQPIALPVPASGDDYFDQEAGVTKSVMLPGAPFSFVKRSFDAYPTMDVFVKALRAAALPGAWVGHIVSYFTNSQGGGHHIRSFASLPIESAEPAKPSTSPDPAVVLTSSQTVPTLPLAVLNLHCEQSGLLADNGSTLFAPLMGPFASLLAILIVQRQAKLASGAGAPFGAPDSGGRPQKGDEL
jgi:hypothetical protein